MSWLSIAAIYFILWWVVLFAILPLGVRNAHEQGAVVEEGHDAGAPMQPQLLRKAMLTTVASLAIFGFFYALFATGVVDLEDLLKLVPAPE